MKVLAALSAVHFLLSPCFAFDSVCSDTVFQQDYANQNMCVLLSEIPEELQNLSYAIYPNNQVYNTERFNFNKRFNLFPHALFKPSTVEEVAFLLKAFKTHKLPFSLRSGGHADEPSSLSLGYVLDLSNFNKIEMNKEREEVTVGAGCRVGNVIQTLGQEGYAIPTGDCLTAGVTGLALGGGIGSLGRAFGLTADSLLNITLIDADGAVREVNEKSYPDLFWAMKGAGSGSWGVVTALKFKMYPLATASFVSLSFPFEEELAAKIFASWQVWQQTLPENITTHLDIDYRSGKAEIRLTGLKIGGDSFNEWREEFASFNPHIQAFTGKYKETASYFHEQMTNPFAKTKSSLLFSDLSSDAIALMVKSISQAFQTKSSFDLSFMFTSLGGKMGQGDTAYFPRKAHILWREQVSWQDPEVENTALEMIRAFALATASYVSPYAASNITDYDLGERYMTAYFGPNSERLREIKKRYDPDNFFHWKQSISP